ncbi:hypothetical protein [Acidithiobacillus sp. AMEEHan]|uniref:hypothetical protein n=1 Tax=Acidithiobacillus sp. AMEEHan TaxID=2994951 RepID=UPI0027E49135|nr:hypothetical protein [Acidithiobacillus sp. AMEEHan]
MKDHSSNPVINGIIVFAVVATVVIAAIATGGATSYAPDPYAWFYTLIIPVFVMLIVVAYYNEKDPY